MEDRLEATAPSIPTRPEKQAHPSLEHSLCFYLEVLTDGAQADLAAEAARYEAAIRDAGGIGLQLLGIGETGHIGFNEPGSPLDSRTREVVLTARTREQNAAMFGGRAEDVPSRALTMGVGTILEAREILLLVTGASKAAMLARALQGPVTPAVTASALRTHPCCTVVADEAAADEASGVVDEPVARARGA